MAGNDPVGVDQKLAHGVAGCFRTLQPYIAFDRLMQFLRMIQVFALPGHIAEEVIECGFYQDTERDQQIIACRTQDGGVEAGVCLGALLQVASQARVLAGLAYLRHLFVGTAQGCEGRRLRLDDVAKFLRRTHETVAPWRRRVPGKHITIQQVPSLTRLNPTANLWSRCQQALGHEHLDRLAHRRTADVEHLGPLRLIGKDGARRIVSPHNAKADLIGNGCVDADPRTPASAPSGPACIRPVAGHCPILLRLAFRHRTCPCLPAGYTYWLPIATSAYNLVEGYETVGA